MTGPTFAPVDADTADLLDLVARGVTGNDAPYARFLLACRSDSEQHGHVSTNCVRRSMSNQYGLVIEPRLYASFWRRACREDGPLRVTPNWELNDDKRGRNSGKPQRLRRWVG